MSDALTEASENTQSGPAAGELISRAGRGIAWQLGALAARITLGVTLQIALARELDVVEFGRFAACLLGVEGLLALSRLQLSTWIISTRGEISGVRRLAFAQLVLSALIFAVAQLVLPTVLGALSSSSLLGAMRIALLALLFDPLAEIARARFERHLRYGLSVLPELVSLPVHAMVAWSLARRGHGEVALAMGLVARSVVFCVLSLLLALRARPEPGAPPADLRAALRFSLPILLNGLLAYAYLHLDDAIVAVVLGETALGEYHVAYRFPHYFLSLNGPLLAVALSVFSRVADDRRRTRAAFSAFTSVGAHLFLVAGAIGIATTPLFVRELLGARWEATIAPMQIFFLLAALRCPGAFWVPLYQARGESRAPLVSTTLSLGILATLGAFAARSAGTVGVAWAVVVAVGVSLVLVVPSFVRRALPEVSLGRLYARPLLVAVTGGLLAHALARALPAHPASFFVAAPGALVVSLSLACLLDRRRLRSWLRVVRESRSVSSESLEVPAGSPSELVT